MNTPNEAFRADTSAFLEAQAETPTEARGRLVVISGPSGVGKGTLCRRLVSVLPTLRLSVSCTSRTQRPQEVEGADYYFLTPEAFEARIAEDAFLEWARYGSNLYGTLRKPVENLLSEGLTVLLEIDVQGALQVKARDPEACLVFIAPPSFEELEGRLRGRGTNTEDDILRRLDMARRELAEQHRFEHVLVNADLDACVAELTGLLAEG